MRSVHPGELLQEELEEGLQLTIEDAALALRTPRANLQSILHGKSKITPKMALKIGRLVGSGPGLWLRMQDNYDRDEEQEVNRY
jgi:addiction module HigA family antidote